MGVFLMSLDTACLFNHQHLLDISSLSSQDITLILDKAEEHIVVKRRVNKKQSLLKGLTLINLFFGFLCGFQYC